MIPCVPSLRLALLACWLGLAQTAPGRGEDEPFPEKPAGLVEDKAGVMLPAGAEALNEELLAGGRDRGISVYVLTIPALHLPPSARKGRLSELGHRYVERWAGGTVAMVFIFEDEGGEAAVIASRETDRRFPPFSRNMALADPLRQIQRGGGLAREKVEASARTILAGLSQLQDEAAAAARRDRIVNCTMVGIVLVAAVLLLLRTFLKSRTLPPTMKTGEP